MIAEAAAASVGAAFDDPIVQAQMGREKRQARRATTLRRRIERSRVFEPIAGHKMVPPDWATLNQAVQSCALLLRYIVSLFVPSSSRFTVWLSYARFRRDRLREIVRAPYPKVHQCLLDLKPMTVGFASKPSPVRFFQR